MRVRSANGGVEWSLIGLRSTSVLVTETTRTARGLAYLTIRRCRGAFQCENCAREHLVPFSCKGRGWCPSCGGRRMTERAHLVHAVLPRVPVRRYRLAWNHGLSRAVLRAYTRVLLDGVPGGRTGSVTVMQRAGSGLNVNLHFHTLVLDGQAAGVEPHEIKLSTRAVLRF